MDKEKLKKIKFENIEYLETWDREDISNWLTKNEMGEWMEIFKRYGVDGDSIISIEFENWKEMEELNKEKIKEKLFELYIRYYSFIKQKIPKYIVCEKTYILKGVWKEHKAKKNLSNILFYL
eukprot:TRINITY_DN10707_c0_g1_i1.p1 TRINITY_DN10707_c0_g1~~TRINITY_DN10707_c0_g1_i1.p1  ORF type:complete len:122 (-),score=18.33 TRINITY_DN10707_c0_g1_i1:16-381(-)